MSVRTFRKGGSRAARRVVAGAASQLVGSSRRRVLFAVIAAVAAIPATAQSAEEIIARMEGNQVHRSAYVEGSMTVSDRFGVRTSTYRSWSEGEDRMLIEFTSTAEAGQKILRVEDDLFLFFPDAEELIPIRGSSLGDSVMGSDMSYEDLTGNRGLLDDYDVTLTGTEIVDGHECYVIELEARSRRVPYAQQTMWVDVDEYVYRRVQQFSRSGRLMKELTVTGLAEQDGKLFPSAMRIEDKLRRGTYTLFEMTEIDLDATIPPQTFSLENLSF